MKSVCNFGLDSVLLTKSNTPNPVTRPGSQFANNYGIGGDYLVAGGPYRVCRPMNQVLNYLPIAYSASGIGCQVMDGGDCNVEGWLRSALGVVWNVTRCGVKERYHRFERTCCSHEVILGNPRKIQRDSKRWTHTRGRPELLSLQTAYLLKLMIPTTNALPRWRPNV